MFCVSIDAPFLEEIVKYLVFRFVAYRGVIADPQGVLAFAALSGCMFGLYENEMYFGETNLPETLSWRLKAYLTRFIAFVGHPVYAGITAARFCQRRFLGRDWGMWSCIWPSILIFNACLVEHSQFHFGHRRSHSWCTSALHEHA